MRCTCCVFSFVVFVGLCSCARMRTEPDRISVSEEYVEATVVAIDEDDILDEESSDSPSFVNMKYPNPSSLVLVYAFRLPVPAHARIDLRTDDGRVISKVVYESLKAGAYKLTFNNLSIIDPGYYVVMLLINGELVGTRNFTLLK